VSEPRTTGSSAAGSTQDPESPYQSDGQSAFAGALLLGAGFGRRFGSDKRLAALGSRSVAEQTVARYRQIFANVRVVIRAEDTELRERLAPSAELVVAHQARLGMGHSLAAGVKELGWTWVFIGLLDMPLIRDTSLQTLLAKAQHCKAQVIRPRHVSQPLAANSDAADSSAISIASIDPTPGHYFGHPIGWHNSTFQALRTLTGDQGARDILRRGEFTETIIDLDDPGLIFDIDRPDQLREIERGMK
tara:strand:- start:210 stop:950 length:741 start_codon:yes stop_codon:yes gene_type:complete